MQTKRFQFQGVLFLILGAILLFVYAILFPALLPISEKAHDYSKLVVNRWWIPLAAIAFVGVIATMIGFAAVYTRFAERAGAWGLFGFIVVEFAHLLQACKVTWEIFLYPIIVNHPGSVFLLSEGVLKNDPLVSVFRAAASLSILVGIVSFCIAIIRSKEFPQLAGYMVLFGALLYGGGAMLAFAISITGIATYSAGCLWLGFHLCKKNLAS